MAVRLTGGVGNQLFGFACAYAQARRLGTSVQLETDPGVKDPTRPLSLLPLVDGREIQLGDQPSELDFVELGFTFDRRVEEIRPGTRLIGYFQSWRYFEAYADELKQRLHDSIKPSSVGALQAAAATAPHIAVQVRRGDYLQPRVRRYHGVCSERYYLDGIDEIRSEVGHLPVVVYTDDIDFGGQLTARIDTASLDVPEPDESPLSVLLRLSGARAFVISNSSFGWWGAWLARDPAMVIAPDPWFAHARLTTHDLIPPNWTTRAADIKITAGRESSQEKFRTHRELGGS